MFDVCMYDPFDQCFGECPDCPRYMKEEKYETDDDDESEVIING